MRRVVGRRVMPALTASASARGMAEVAQFTATLTALAPIGLMNKGVYRFKSHAEANEHQTQAIAARMAALARRRSAIR